MPFRFQKRLKLLKGLTLNLSKGGASVTVGKKGAGINIGKNGVTGNAGIPGTGISYREKLSGKPLASLAQPLFWLLLIALIGFVLGGGSLEAVLKNLLALIQP
ncbi:MAG TPA: hypothetical protein DCY07_01055 [Rhodospirillaceae bacterium]|nr:hypothetical protein [Rhodospirillaceae bacterium]